MHGNGARSYCVVYPMRCAGRPWDVVVASSSLIHSSTRIGPQPSGLSRNPLTAPCFSCFQYSPVPFCTDVSIRRSYGWGLCALHIVAFLAPKAMIFVSQRTTVTLHRRSPSLIGVEGYNRPEQSLPHLSRYGRATHWNAIGRVGNSTVSPPAPVVPARRPLPGFICHQR